jgi:hypothetical protein
MSIPEVDSRNRLLGFLKTSLRLVDNVRSKILSASVADIGTLRTAKINTQTRDLHIYGDNTPNNYGIKFDESNGHVSINKSIPSTTYEFRVGGDIFADDTLYASDNVYAVGSEFFGYGAHIGTLNIDLGSGQRAEFGKWGGYTYSTTNGALWASSQASNQNAQDVLEAQSSNNGRLYDVLGPGAYGTKIYFYATTAIGAGGTATTRRVELSTQSNPFTGQHPCEPLDEMLTLHREDYVGLIVRSSGDYKRWDEANQAWETGKESITINEALPRVELTSNPQDKAAFGVISNMPNDYSLDTETGKYEKDEDGVAIGFGNIKENQLRINSLGEGAIWVCNISGNLENGDYITTCEIPGLGMKQDDDLLHNYTVAKITQDCDFRINAANYNVVEFEFSGSTYRKAFVGCTYHCG